MEIAIKMFHTQNDPIRQRVVAGLNKIGLAIKSQTWEKASPRGLTPTQAQILVILRSTDKTSLRLKDVAEGLAVSSATACEAVSALARKGMVRNVPRGDDARATAITLTAKGRREADRVATWPDFLLEAVDALSAAEQEVFLRALIKMIKLLQDRHTIHASRMCVTCRYFRPYVHADTRKPHHCAFVDAPFGDRHLRLDCLDYVAAETQLAETSWKVWQRKEVIT